MEENIYKQSIEKWGVESQFNQMVEECAELIVAINKYKRFLDGEKKQTEEEVMFNLYEEIADVKICIEELEYILGSEKISEVYKLKMQKFLNQIKS